MCIDERLRRVRSWRRKALQTSAFIVTIAVGGSLIDRADLSAQARAGGTPSGDPCRFATAEAVGKAFGRAMQMSKLGNVCQYRGKPTELVVVRVTTGPEGTLLGFARRGVAQGQKEAEKVKTSVGEAYFDASVPGFIGRVGNSNLQIETTIEPIPRDALIAVGTRILETLAK